MGSDADFLAFRLRSRGRDAMKVTASGSPRRGFALSIWPSVLVGFLAIKAVLSLVLGPGDKLAPYGASIYFLLLLVATGFAARNAVERTQDRPLHRRSGAMTTRLAIDRKTLE
jgi:hypothetical protein